MALADEAFQPHSRIFADLVDGEAKLQNRDEGGRAAQEPVQVLYEPLRCHQQPGPVRYLADPVAGMLHGLVRGPAGKENDPAFPGRALRPHQAVVEAEEVQTPASLFQVHDPDLAAFLQAEAGQQGRQALQRQFGLAADRHYTRLST